MIPPMKNKRVLIGMSGGVDSSVAAALLKRRGYDVIGFTLQLLPENNEKQSACCNLDSICDAKRVANKIGIPHYTIEFRDTFKEKVIDYFVNGYLSGQTPNPCVECNRHIKFNALEQKARELGADYVATGHYCIRTQSPTTKEYFLKKAKDATKDQTYFLYMVTQEQLKHTLFPLGRYLKPQIRKMAEEWGLINAHKPDSQEICFVTQANYKNFIEKHSQQSDRQKGFITDKNGIILGEHSGIYQFTIGQRKGLGLSHPTPLFVVDINPRNNTVIVGDKHDLQMMEAKVHTFTLINPNQSYTNRTLLAKTRYQMTPMQAKIKSYTDTTAIIEFTAPQSQLTPGQSCVLYEKDGRVVGGGIIDTRN